jgi:MFS family permease
MSSTARDNIETAPSRPNATLADAKDEHDATLETSDDDEETTYPDGGLEAWLVVLGSFCGMYVPSPTLRNTLSKSQQRSKTSLLRLYEQHQHIQLFTHLLSPYSTSSVGWIFSIYIFLTFLCGVFIGPVFDARGPRVLVFAGSVSLMASVMLMGICTGACVRASECGRTLQPVE